MSHEINDIREPGAEDIDWVRKDKFDRVWNDRKHIYECMRELQDAARQVVKHVQIARCECFDLPKFSCCTCGAYEHAEAIGALDRVLGR